MQWLATAHAEAPTPETKMRFLAAKRIDELSKLGTQNNWDSNAVLKFSDFLQQHRRTTNIHKSAGMDLIPPRTKEVFVSVSECPHECEQWQRSTENWLLENLTCLLNSMHHHGCEHSTFSMAPDNVTGVVWRAEGLTI